MSNNNLALHTVEKIGGTSMSRTQEVLDNVLVGKRQGKALYQRIFVVSAYGGMTNKLLEHKKTGEPGVYELFAKSSSDWSWGDALSDVHRAMMDINEELFTEEYDRNSANQFLAERIEGVRSCLLDLQRLCSFGHFRIDEHLATVREMLASLGETHSAFNTVLLLNKLNVNARFVDLTGWRVDENLPLDERIKQAFGGIDLTNELPIVTGYAHCSEGMMRLYDRGYSEITFSHIATVTRAREAIIHKEYHLSSADPRVVGEDKVEPIGHTNYDVADHLSSLGMEAIHPKAAKGLCQLGIPLRIKNTFEPEHRGTVISQDYRSEQPSVEMVAGRKDAYAIEIFDQEMLGQDGYSVTVQREIEKARVDVVAYDRNANTMTYYVAGTLSEVERAVKGIRRHFENADVNTSMVAVVSVLGSDMQIKGLTAGVVNALSSRNISILGLHQSPRQVEIQTVVNRTDYDEAVRALHRDLMEQNQDNKSVCAA